MAIKLTLKPGKYVVAVSGGVDSMVLLDLLSKLSGDYEFIVAHYQHNVRSQQETEADEQLVAAVTRSYGYTFVLGSYAGDKHSESVLRAARYAFLHQVRQNNNYNAIITAHHEDDLIETAIINLLRGTHSAGLRSITSSDELVRPLLHVTKAQIRDYAKDEGLSWNEDITNADQTYLRNYVRYTIVPKLKHGGTFDELRSLALRHAPLDSDLQAELAKLSSGYDKLPNGLAISRSDFIQMPHVVSLSVMNDLIKRSGDSQAIHSKLLQNATQFAKTAQHNTGMDLTAHLRLEVTPENIEILRSD